jgi:hypothetical protein
MSVGVVLEKRVDIRTTEKKELVFKCRRILIDGHELTCLCENHAVFVLKSAHHCSCYSQPGSFLERDIRA